MTIMTGMTKKNINDIFDHHVMSWGPCARLGTVRIPAAQAKVRAIARRSPSGSLVIRM